MAKFPPQSITYFNPSTLRNQSIFHQNTKEKFNIFHSLGCTQCNSFIKTTLIYYLFSSYYGLSQDLLFQPFPVYSG